MTTMKADPRFKDHPHYNTRSILVDIDSHAIDRYRQSDRGKRDYRALSNKALSELLVREARKGVLFVEVRHNGSVCFYVPSMGVDLVCQRRGFAWYAGTVAHGRWADSEGPEYRTDPCRRNG